MSILKLYSQLMIIVGTYPEPSGRTNLANTLEEKEKQDPSKRHQIKMSKSIIGLYHRSIDTSIIEVRLSLKAHFLFV